MTRIAIVTITLIVGAWMTFIFAPEVFSVVKSDIEIKHIRAQLPEGNDRFPKGAPKIYSLMYISNENPPETYRLNTFLTEDECIQERDSEGWKVVLYDQFKDKDPKLICQTRSFQY